MSYYQTFVPLINIQQTNKHLKKTMYIVKYDLLYLFFVNFLYILYNPMIRTGPGSSTIIQSADRSGSATRKKIECISNFENLSG